jgi:hypothetical protein
MLGQELLEYPLLRLVHFDEFYAKALSFGPPDNRKRNGKGAFQSRKIQFELERLCLRDCL